MKFLNYDEFVVNEWSRNELATESKIKNTKEFNDILKSFPVDYYFSMYYNKYIGLSFLIKSLHVFDINTGKLPIGCGYAYANLSIKKN